MRCWRFDLRGDLTRYATGDLGVLRVRRIEDHLLGCVRCRASVARLRSGHKMAQAIPRVVPVAGHWSQIVAAIERESSARENRLGPNDRLPVTAVAFPAIVLAILLFGFLIASGIRELRMEPSRNASLIAPLELEEFHPVKISEIGQSTEPHVFADGYVREIRREPDGDLSFKLAENTQPNAPFIVCEIINPLRLSSPVEGSYVRVYGVSRRDNEVGHDWYEVHPVLNIHPLGQ